MFFLWVFVSITFTISNMNRSIRALITAHVELIETVKANVGLECKSHTKGGSVLYRWLIFFWFRPVVFCFQTQNRRTHYTHKLFSIRLLNIVM